MKTTRKLMLAALVLGSSTVAHAAGGAGSELGFGTFLFLGFLALILVFQMVPGLILFFSMLKGLFAPLSGKPSAPLAGGKSEKSL
ncbi:MAG TPA: hypothetical protein VD811_15355 [Desulfuromonadales bacterium]|jgi:hypothetical protein|nr:hypothetical protein [Desulfuromonadales bacterium]